MISPKAKQKLLAAKILNLTREDAAEPNVVFTFDGALFKFDAKTRVRDIVQLPPKARRSRALRVDRTPIYDLELIIWLSCKICEPVQNLQLHVQSHNARPTECSVEQAADCLQVSDRSILNYIRAKKVKALKVGKQWFVDVASLDAFALNYGFAIQPEESPPVVTPAKPDPRLPPPPVVPGTSNARTRNPCALACFRLCLDAFKMPLWRDACNAEDELVVRIRALRLVAIESLGAGYYTFGRAKCASYNVARNAVGSMVALLYSEPRLTERFATEVLFLQQKVLPAFAALLIKMERDPAFQRRTP